MVNYFVSITDDKDRGWAAPSDDSGKIFTYTRPWACDPQDSTPTYDQAEHFLQFERVASCFLQFLRSFLHQ